MIKYFNYILIFIIIIHLLQFLSNILSNNEYFDIIWNYPSRINNYVYDIRGYPDQYCLNTSNDRKFIVPCFYKNNSKFDIDGIIITTTK